MHKKKDLVWLFKNLLALIFFFFLFGSGLFLADFFTEICLADKIKEILKKSVYSPIWGPFALFGSWKFFRFYRYLKNRKKDAK